MSDGGDAPMARSEPDESDTPYSKSGVVTGDEEVWLCDRIRTAIDTAAAIRGQPGVRADERAREEAVEGLINGTALEIINTLDLQTEGVNLSPRHSRDEHLIYTEGDDE